MLPVASFAPGGLIKSSDDNTNNNDIAAALTQSLATTGVSTMTGQLIASAGLVSGPSYAFNGASKTGLYLAGTNQIGIAVNGTQAGTINADTSVTFNGTVTALKGTVPVGAVMDFAGPTAPAGWLLCYGQQVSTTTYALLYAVLGTTYGSGAGTFGIPDYRGSVGAGLDNMGGTPAGRLGSIINGTSLGAFGGTETITLSAGNIPTITSSGSITTSGTLNFGTNIPETGASITQFSLNSSGSGLAPTITSGSWGSLSSIGGTFSGFANLTSNNTGGIYHSNLQPTVMCNRIIYAGV